MRLLVPAGESERALAILEAARVGHADSGTTDQASPAAIADNETDDESSIDSDGTDAATTPRELDAFQAFKLAVFGLLLCPLQLFVPYYIARVLLNPAAMRARYYFYVLASAVIVFPYAVAGFAFAYLFFTEP